MYYTIVTAADEKFSDGLVCLIKSILMTWDDGQHLKIHILDNGLSVRSKLMCERVVDGNKDYVEIVFICVSEVMPDDLPRLRDGFSLAPYARLWIPEVIDCDDLLYCDSDFLFGLNPRLLIDECREIGISMAAVQEGESTVESDCPWVENLSSSERQSPYFNTGLMYWNLSDPLFDNLPERSLKLITSSENKPKLADQTVLNYLFAGRVHLLDRKFNDIYLSNRELMDWSMDSNIHYVGQSKPFLSKRNYMRYLIRNCIFDAYAENEVDVDSEYFSHFDLMERVSWVRQNIKCFCFKPSMKQKLKNIYVTKDEFESANERIRKLIQQRQRRQRRPLAS